MKREVEINRFQVKSETANEYTILEYQEEIEATGIDSNGRRLWLPGLKRLITSNGFIVNYIDAKTFEIVRGTTKETVRKI